MWFQHTVTVCLSPSGLRKWCYKEPSACQSCFSWHLLRWNYREQWAHTFSTKIMQGFSFFFFVMTPHCSFSFFLFWTKDVFGTTVQAQLWWPYSVWIFPASQALLKWAVQTHLPAAPEPLWFAHMGSSLPCSNFWLYRQFLVPKDWCPWMSHVPAGALPSGVDWCRMSECLVELRMHCLFCLVLYLTVVSGLIWSYNQIVFFLSLNQCGWVTEEHWILIWPNWNLFR